MSLFHFDLPIVLLGSFKTCPFRELRLLESMEALCERLLSYNIHKEKKGLTRFAPGISQTFQTLEGLV